MYLEWHPTAENILLSAGYDHLIFVWNIATGQCVNVIDCHEDTIYSMSFNRYSTKHTRDRVGVVDHAKEGVRGIEEDIACRLG